MAEKIVSPGVYTNEIDQSFLPATLGPIGAAIVGPTVKGPVLTPTVVSSYSEYVQIFGEVIQSGSDSYQYLTSHTAKEYLRQGGPCTIVRVSKPNTAKATADIGAAAVDAVSAVKASAKCVVAAVPTAGQTLIFTIPNLGGGNSTFTITFDAAGNYTSEVYWNETSTDTFVATIGINDGTVTNVGVAIDALMDQIPGYVGSLSQTTDPNDTATLTADDNGVIFDFTTTGTAVSGNKITVTQTAAVAAVDAVTDSLIFTLEALGDGPQFNSTSSISTDGVLAPFTSSATNDHWSSGSFGGTSENFRWEVSQRNLNKGTFTLLLRRGDDSNSSKQIIETHSDLSLDPQTSNYILKRIGDRHQTVITEDGVAYLQDSGSFPNKSKLVRVKQLYKKTDGYLVESTGEVDSAKYPNPANFFPQVGSGSYGGAFGDVQGGTKHVAGDLGQDQIIHPPAFYDSISNTNSQGVKMADSAAGVGTGGYKTAISLLKHKDEYDFNLLFVPGVIDQIGSNHSGIIQDAIQLCEDRGDCFLVYDNTSKTSTVAQAKSNTEARNSSYAATYYPWVQIQDSSLGVYRYVPPSVVMAGVYHFNDTIGQPWFAPAGLNRGGIDSAVQAFKKLSQSQRDDLYDSNMNPIATFPGQGVTAFGQKTTQKKASALDRVNVRRLLINVKKFVARSSRTLVFEQNTTDLRNQFLNVVNPYMEQVQANSGLNAFRVVMDDSNNTPETIDRNQLIGQIFLQPTRTAEFIVLDFVVQPTGAEFPE